MIHAECGNAHLQEPPWGRAPGGLPSQWLWPSGMCRLCKAPFVPEGLEHDFRNKMTLKLRRKRRKKRIGDNINVTVRQPQDPTTATQETSRDLGALPSKGCHQVGTQGQPVACWLLGLYFSHSGRWWFPLHLHMWFKAQTAWSSGLKSRCQGRDLSVSSISGALKQHLAGTGSTWLHWHPVWSEVRAGQQRPGASMGRQAVCSPRGHRAQTGLSRPSSWLRQTPWLLSSGQGAGGPWPVPALPCLCADLPAARPGSHQWPHSPRQRHGPVHTGGPVTCSSQGDMAEVIPQSMPQPGEDWHHLVCTLGNTEYLQGAPLSTAGTSREKAPSGCKAAGQNQVLSPDAPSEGGAESLPWSAGWTQTCF